MSRLRLVFPTLFAAWGAAFFAAAIGSAQEAPKTPAPEAKKQASPQAEKAPPPRLDGEARIREALDDITTVNFFDTPLRDALQFLEDAHQIPIEIDVAALADAGLRTDAPLTMELRGISLRSALRLMLRQVSLTYRIADETLVITTPQEAARRPATRVYPVAHLLVDGARMDALAQVVRTVVQQRDPAAPGAASTATVTTYGPLLIVRDTEAGQEEVEELLSQLEAGLRSAHPPRPRMGGDPFGVPAAEPPAGKRQPDQFGWDPFGPPAPQSELDPFGGGPSRNGR